MWRHKNTCTEQENGQVEFIKWLKTQVEFLEISSQATLILQRGWCRIICSHCPVPLLHLWSYHLVEVAQHIQMYFFSPFKFCSIDPIWAWEVTPFGDEVHQHSSQAESVFCYKVTFQLNWSHYQPCLILFSKKSGSLLCSLLPTKFCSFCIGLNFVFSSISYVVFADVRG